MQALQAVLLPLARLCLAQGIPFGLAEELLKHAYVDAARGALSGAAGKRDISRVSTATGLNRREVTRLSGTTSAPAQPRRSPATQAFTKWMSDPALQDMQGQPLALKRQGPAPSFETLAQSVTRDVHPRSVLEDICRLGLARLDEETDTVHLVTDAFVPSEDKARLLSFLGGNVGDHLSAAVANVVSGERQHFEQAIFADELSAESLAEARKLVSAQWKNLLAALVPQLEAMIKADAEAGRAAEQRLRIGLYSYGEAMMPAPPQSNPGD